MNKSNTTPKTGLNITNGEARVQNNTDGDPFSREVNGKLVAKAFEGMHPYATVKANAHLIAEAFNVYNETGLTPRKLLEDRNILIDITKDSMERMIKSLPSKELNLLIETLKTFINDNTK